MVQLGDIGICDFHFPDVPVWLVVGFCPLAVYLVAPVLASCLFTCTHICYCFAARSIPSPPIRLPIASPDVAHRFYFRERITAPCFLAEVPASRPPQTLSAGAYYNCLKDFNKYNWHFNRYLVNRLTKRAYFPKKLTARELLRISCMSSPKLIYGARRMA